MQMLANYSKWGIAFYHPNGAGIYYVYDDAGASPDSRKMKLFDDLPATTEWLNKSSWVERDGAFITQPIPTFYVEVVMTIKKFER